MSIYSLRTGFCGALLRAAALLLLAAPLTFAALTITTTALPDAMSGMPYSFKITVSGATGTPECYASMAELPSQLILNPWTCEFSGSPAAAGSYSILIVVKSGTQEASKRFSLLVKEGIRLSYFGTSGAVGVPFSLAPTISGGKAPYSFKLSSGTLPPGIQLNASTGVLSGTPITKGAYYPWITATDSAGASGMGRADISISGPLIQVSPPGPALLPRGKVGYPYSFQFTASGGKAPLTFVSMGVAPGLTLSANGLLSGAPARGGLARVTFTVRDADGNDNGTNDYQFTVDPGAELSPAYGMLPNATVGTAYAFAFTVAGMGAGLGGSLSGQVPPGLRLTPSASGVTLEGNPTQAGAYTFTVRVTDSAGVSVSGEFIITVVAKTATPLKFDTQALPDGQARAPYTARVAVSGGLPPYQFSLPNVFVGLSINRTTGEITGTFDKAANFYLTVEVTDAAMNRVQTTFLIRFLSPALLFSYDPLPVGVVGTPYPISVRITVSDGLLPYSMRVISGSLPPGISLTPWGSSDFDLTGIPTKEGAYSFRLGATDMNGKQGSVDLTLIVRAQTLSILPAFLPGCVVNTPCDFSLAASGGTPPYTFFLLSGIAPVKVNEDGRLSGPAPVAGTYTFSVVATDSKGARGVITYTLVVAEGGVLISGDLSGLRLGASYQSQLSASGGTAPYSFSLLSGYPPPGMSLSSTGLFSGTPTSAGTWTFVVRAADASGRFGQRQFDVSVQGRLLEIGPASLPDLISGQAYSVQLTATGGAPPYTFQLTQATLWSSGMFLSPSGLLHGSAALDADAVSDVLIQVTDAQGSTANKFYRLNMKKAAGLQMTPVQLPEGRVGVRYSAQLDVAGGRPPYSFTVLSSNLPAWFFFRSDGLISGTPDRSGTFLVTIQASDSSGAVVSREYRIQISSTGISISPTYLPTAERGKAYSATLSASGGRPPYRFTLIGGALPQGIVLRENGVIDGTASVPGVSDIRISVVDADGSSGEAAYSFTVSDSAMTISPQSLAEAKLGVEFNANLTCLGGQGSCEFSVSSGQLPKGLALGLDGRIRGVPLESGLFRFQCQVRDQGGKVAVQNFEVRVSEVQLLPESMQETKSSVPVQVQFQTNPALTGVEYKLGKGALPPGLQLSPSGKLSGAVAAPGRWTFEIEAVWNGAVAGRRTYDLRIVAPLAFATPDLPPALAGRFYRAQLAAQGGLPPYVFEAAAPALDGLQLSKDGVLAGIPSKEGTRSLPLVVKDAAGEASTRVFTLLVEQQSLRIETVWAPAGRVRAGYSLPLAATGGDPPYKWRLDSGALPAGLALDEGGLIAGTPSQSGVFGIVLRASDQFGRQADRALSISIQAAPGQWSVEPRELEFVASSSGTPSQCVAVFGEALKVTAELQLSGFRWAELTSDSTTLPGRFCVAADPVGLAAGEWRGQLVLTAQGGSPPAIRIPVALRVAPRPEVALSVLPQQPQLVLPAGVLEGIIPVVLLNAGSRPALVSVQGGLPDWLRVPADPVDIPPGQTTSLEWQVDARGLSEGLHTATVRLGNEATALEVPVRLLAGGNAMVLEATRHELDLTLWKGSGALRSTSLVLRNSGRAALDLRLRKSGQAAAWLEARSLGEKPLDGLLAPGESREIQVSAETGDSQPGVYQALLAFDGGVSPLEIPVTVRLLDLQSSGPEEPSAAAVTLSRVGSELDSRTEWTSFGPASRRGPVQVVIRGGVEATWLSVKPVANADASGALPLLISVNWAALGSRASAQAVVSIGFADGTAETFAVNALNRASAETPGSVINGTAIPACAGVPELLVLEPAPDFRSTAGAPVPIQAALLDPCRGADPAARLVARLGSASVELMPVASGLFAGTLRPEGAGDTGLEVFALSADNRRGSVSVRGKVRGASGTPRILQVLTGAGSSGPATPDAWILIEGDQLSSSEAFDSSAPQELGGLTITLGGIPLRLMYVSPQRIDAYVPRETPIGGTSSLLISSGKALRASARVLVTRWHPQIYTVDGRGQGLAIASDAEGGVEINAAAPAAPGAVVRLLVYGLDPTAACRVWLGGHEAAPVEVNRPSDLPGLSEVRFTVPLAAAGQSAAPLQIRQGTVESNVAVLPIRRN